MNSILIEGFSQHVMDALHVSDLFYEFGDADTVSLVEGDGAAQAVQLP